MKIKDVIKKNKTLVKFARAYRKRFGITKYSEEMNEFCRLNREIWKSRRVKGTDDGIVLVHFSTDFPGSFWPAMKRAEALREKYGYKICAILNGYFKNNNNIFRIIDSFCVDEVIYEDDQVKKQKNYLKENTEQAFNQLISEVDNIDDFVDWCLDDIKIGDLIYDAIVANHDIVTIDDFELILKEYKPDVIELFNIFFFYRFLFSHMLVKSVVVSENTYARAILVRMAVKNSLITVCASSYACTEYNESNVYRTPFALINKISKSELIERVSTDPELVNASEQYFNDRLNGLNDAFCSKLSYVDKKILARPDLIQLLDINPEYNTVLVAPHCFSDCIHGVKHWVFRDYYEWLIYTLEVLKNVKGIDVLFKPHPYAIHYGKAEVDAFDSIVEKYDFIKVIPNELSTTSVLAITDVVLTACGTIALEAACLGIESINVCEPYYGGYDLVKTIKDKVSYHNYLSTLNEERKEISSNIMTLAKIVLYLVVNSEMDGNINLAEEPIRPGDDLDLLLKQQYNYLNCRIDDERNVIDDQYKRWLA